MDAIKKIIEIKGLSKENPHCKIKNPPYMDLVIEILPDNLVSVAHYSEQNGDLMADPEMIFRVVQSKKFNTKKMDFDQVEEWVPVYYKNDFMGKEIDLTDKPDIKLKGDFHKLWNKNLKDQGFVKESKKK